MLEIEKVVNIDPNLEESEKNLTNQVTAENLEESESDSASFSELSEESTTENESSSNEPVCDNNSHSETENKGGKLHRVRDWWIKHKPSKRRLIQIYAALLFNANIKGFITGEIFTGITKVACVPGMNCYSCPGAVGACPLGALQNALAAKNHRAPYYILGILLLYSVIFGRTICGFLCPVGLGQDLLYKIKTPKLKKNRFTRILSYLKYVMLAVLVFGVTLVFTGLDTVVPGFCKYICPAGTFGGAIMLLLHPANASMYSMLGPLFTWKMIVLIVVMVASIFIYRAFCRFLCPLGAIYGIFNHFAMLGIKVNHDKCTDCGKCVKVCKMDVKKVGDHECINCGECIGSCPTKAITWKGGKIFLKDDEVQKVETVELNEENINKPIFDEVAFDDVDENKQNKELITKTNKQKKKLKKDKQFWIKVVAITLAVVLFVGVFTYVNFFASTEKAVSATYDIVVNNIDGESGLLEFTIGNSTDYIIPSGGSGTQEDPYVIKNIEGIYSVIINKDLSDVYFRYTATEPKEYDISTNSDKLSLRVYYILSEKSYAVYDIQTFDSNKIVLSLDLPEGVGNAVGFTCFDFTLKNNIDESEITLSDFRGKTVIINFWATWCGPCVAELPHFEDIRKLNENVEVIAIHSASVDNNVKEFIQGKWADWGIIWAQDRGTSADSEIYSLLGGRNGAYPRTLVIDKNGIVRFVFEGSVTKDKLEQAVKSIA